MQVTINTDVSATSSVGGTPESGRKIKIELSPSSRDLGGSPGQGRNQDGRNSPSSPGGKNRRRTFRLTVETNDDELSEYDLLLRILRNFYSIFAPFSLLFYSVFLNFC